MNPTREQYEEAAKVIDAISNTPTTPIAAIAEAVREAAERGAQAERAANEARAWRAIATAPKDGTLVLLYLAGEPGWNRYTVATWSDHSRDWCGISAAAGGICGWKNPTHWQPLPAPPASEE